MPCSMVFLIPTKITPLSVYPYASKYTRLFCYLHTRASVGICEVKFAPINQLSPVYTMQYNEHLGLHYLVYNHLSRGALNQ